MAPAYVHADPNRDARIRVGKPYCPMPMTMIRSARPTWTPSSSNGTQSDNCFAVTAIFTTSAPVDRMACACAARSVGTPSKSCVDSTMRCPPDAAMRSSKRARHSTSTYSAPSFSASARMRRRSSSEPAKLPPSHFGRQVTMAGRPRPASAAAALGSATESRRSSTRSASVTASRLRRSSAVVAPVTVTQRSGFVITK
ncbi:MAG: hypothetical protein DMF99_11215 [Acidobacteria bacterium]|nr:MAG: hypothetical protein DMF99_11215 [Acidobacteriota bacterium]